MDPSREKIAAVFKRAGRDTQYHISTMVKWQTPKVIASGYIQDRRVVKSDAGLSEAGDGAKDEAEDNDDEDEPKDEAEDDDEDETDSEGEADNTGEAEADDTAEAEADTSIDTSTKALVDKALGAELDERIQRIHQLPPASLDQLPDLTRIPYKHQLFAVSRLAYMATSPSKGGILADPMGFGKTRSSILAAMYMERKQNEGPILVVTKKSLIRMWQTEITKTFQTQCQPSVLVLTGNITPWQLYDYDIVITNFETVVAQYSAISRYKDSFRDDNTAALPDRPSPSILSDVHKVNDRRFRLIVDEAQFLKNYESVTNAACREIYRSYTILITGTPLDNHWSDIFGIIQLLEGHPFTSIELFLSVFGTTVRKGKQVQPDEAKTELLRRLVLSLTIARPVGTIPLQSITETDVHVALAVEEQGRSDFLFEKYLKARKRKHGLGNNRADNKSALSLITQAVQEATHPSLKKVSPKEDRSDVWMAEIRRTGLANKSSRMLAFDTLFQRILHDYPDERVVITAEHTGVLDLVSVIVGDIGTLPLLYDGRVPVAARGAILQQFQTSVPGSTTLLLTPGTGGTGLNIPEASVMVQIAPWWNRNTELQMYSRLRRPGQNFPIKIFRIVSSAKAEGLIVLKQRAKSVYNETLMQGIQWEDTAPIMSILPGFVKLEMKSWEDGVEVGEQT